MTDINEPPWVVEIDGLKFATPEAVVILLKAVSEERDDLEAKVAELREALDIAKEYGPIGAPEVHRAWRDVMLEQKRNVTTERMEWRLLSTQDKYLDEEIASAIVEDFLVWYFAHQEALDA